MNPKLSEELQTRLAADATGMLDVIIELHDPEEPPEEHVQSRQERIAAQKESFERYVSPLEEALRSSGGEVKGHAWINRTLRARVLVEKLDQLSAFPEVARIDVPHRLAPDA